VIAVPERPFLALLACLCVGPACRSKATPPAPGTVASVSAKASAAPVDRLAPDELAPGNSHVFGFEVPRGMSLRGAFDDVAYIEGDVAPEAVANYVRDRVEVEHVEIGAARTVFPQARIKGGPPDRYYQFDVVASSPRYTNLSIRDVTPRPPNPPGMTETDRWRQAGRGPDGKPIREEEMR
jgi:hypothetical protein